MKNTIKEIKESVAWEKINRVFENTVKCVNLEMAQNEAMAMHANRDSRKLKSNQNRYDPNLLIDCCLQDLSFRARMVEIRVKIDLQCTILRESVTYAKNFILTKWASEIGDEYKTIDQKKSFVDRLLKNQLEFLGSVKSLLDLIDVLIKDIDQSGHSMRHIVDCLKLLQGNKAGVNL